MENVLIGKDLTTNADINLSLPSVILVAGDKLSGKTFLVRQLIERINEHKVILLTNKPESYHGLQETFIKIDKDHPEMTFDHRITIIDASELYEDDPNHILDQEIRDLREEVQEGDVLIVDEVYPYLDDEYDKYELLKTVELLREKGATVLLTTNQEKLLLEEGPVLLRLAEYFFCLRQSKTTAIKLCETYAGDRGRYELLRYVDLMDFSKGLFIDKHGDSAFVQVV